MPIKFDLSRMVLRNLFVEVGVVCKLDVGLVHTLLRAMQVGLGFVETVFAFVVGCYGITQGIAAFCLAEPLCSPALLACCIRRGNGLFDLLRLNTHTLTHLLRVNRLNRRTVVERSDGIVAEIIRGAGPRRSRAS